MQTFITDFDFYKSASNLNRQHLQAQIYEGIHILASLLDVNDKLVNPKRNVRNYPQSKLWVGYEKELLYYIDCHLSEWFDRKYKLGINVQNFKMLIGIIDKQISYKEFIFNLECPSWITDELIQTHCSVLIQKEIKKEKELKKELKNNEIEMITNYGWSIYISENNKIHRKIKENYHYRNLWPDCSRNLKMRYDWRYDE